MADPLTGLRAEVTQARVSGLLQKRQPAILDSGNADEVEKFESLVRGAAVEVVLLTGDDLPADSPLRELAIEAIAAQTASSIEYSNYPEQQAPERDGRGYNLHQRYLELLARLRAELDTASGTTGPIGNYPPAEAYPDPIMPSPTRWWW